jgi:hypothetical protein
VARKLGSQQRLVNRANDLPDAISTLQSVEPVVLMSHPLVVDMVSSNFGVNQLVTTTAMRWVRSNLRFGAWCALFALTLQLALSFGHVHVAGFGSTQSTLLAGWTTQPSAPSADAPAAPAKHVPNGLAHDQCAICPVMQLASAAVPSAGPVLELPLVSSQARLGTSVEFVLAASPHFSFSARAPPQA